jgi:hypothetical protein
MTMADRPEPGEPAPLLAGPTLPLEADEADVIEQSLEVPDDDEQRG